MLATAGVKNSPGRRPQEVGGGGWGDGKQKQQTSTWGKVKGRCQLNLSKSFMSFVDLTKFQSYKMLPENPDKIQSDTSSMKRNFRKEIYCSKGSVFRNHLYPFPLTQVCQRLGAEPLGFGRVPRFKSKDILAYESAVLQVNFWFMWLLEKKSGELGPIVEVSLSCEDFRLQTQHPQHQVKIWWESTGFHSNSLNSEFWD